MQFVFLILNHVWKVKTRKKRQSEENIQQNNDFLELKNSRHRFRWCDIVVISSEIAIATMTTITVTRKHNIEQNNVIQSNIYYSLTVMS